MLLVLLGAICMFTAGGAGNLPKHVVGAYFPNWAQYRKAPFKFTPESMEPIIDTLNVVWYGFAYFCPNSSMAQPYWVTQLNLCAGKEPFEVVSIEPKDTQFYQQMTAFKSRNKDLRVILSIGGWNFPSNFYSQMVSDRKSRSTFIKSCVSMMEQHGFDGIDIDWEFPKSPARTDEVKISCWKFDQTQDDGGSPSDGKNFVSLVEEMRSAFGKNKIITVASQADLVKAQDEDIKGLSDHIDMFNLMSYDYTVSDIEDSAVTAPNQPLYPPAEDNVAQKDSVSTTIEGYLRAGIPAEKMSVGIAYYGHSWFVPGLTAESEWCHFGLTAQKQGKCCGPFASTMGAKYGQYSQLCGTYMFSEFQTAGFETCFENVTQSNIGYMVDPQDGYTEKGVWFSYLGTDGVKAVVDYAKHKKLGGAFAFDISMDTMSGGSFSYELTKEIAKLIE